MTFSDIQFTDVAQGLRFPEGPIAMADGSVLLCEIQRGTLSRVDPDGSVSVVADCGGGPNGAAIGPDGAVWITNNGGSFEFHDVGGLLIPGDVPDTWADCSDLENDFGYKPSTPVEEGINRFITWYRDYYDA